MPPTTITITKAQYDRLTRDLEAARQETATARATAQAVRAETSTAQLTKLRELVAHLTVIVDHHVANLHPENTVDLPMEALAGAAALIDTVPGATPRDAERSSIWEERADLIGEWRTRRAGRGDNAFDRIALSTRLSPDRPDDVDERRILVNAARCRDCMTIAQSTGTHDLARCSCGKSFADGGHEYLRRGFGSAGFDEATVWVKGNLPDDLKAAYRDAIQAVIRRAAGHTAQKSGAKTKLAKARPVAKTKRGGRPPRRGHGPVR